MKRSIKKKVHFHLDIFKKHLALWCFINFERWFLKALGAAEQISSRPQKPSCGLHIVHAYCDHRFQKCCFELYQLFWQFSIRPHGWQVNLLFCRSLSAHSSSTSQGTLVAWWNEAILQSFNVVYASKQHVYCTGNKLSCYLCFWGYFIFL